MKSERRVWCRAPRNTIGRHFPQNFKIRYPTDIPTHEMSRHAAQSLHLRCIQSPWSPLQVPGPLTHSYFSAQSLLRISNPAVFHVYCYLSILNLKTPRCSFLYYQQRFPMRLPILRFPEFVPLWLAQHAVSAVVLLKPL